MEWVELAIEPPLEECLSSCETVCVRDCCGLDAFDPSAESIAAWVASAGEASARVAAEQLAAIQAQVADPSNHYSSDFLNYATNIRVSEPTARQDLIDFLAAVQRGLAARR